MISAIGIRVSGALICSCIAVYTDIRTGKVPNRLILTGLSGAFLLRAAFLGSAGCTMKCGLGALRRLILTEAGSFAAGVLLPALFPGVLLPAHMIGGGDVKLFMVIGAFLGGKAVFRITIVSFFMGSLQSVWLLCRQKNAGIRLKPGEMRIHFTISILAALIWNYLN